MVSYSLSIAAGPEIHRPGARFRPERAIVPDLPVEEAEALVRLAAARDFKLIQLVTPTTPKERAVRIANTSTGFLYCVSVTGITGERDRLPEASSSSSRGYDNRRPCRSASVSASANRARAHGARRYRRCHRRHALVRHLEKAGNLPRPQIVQQIGDLAQSLRDALNST